MIQTEKQDQSIAQTDSVPYHMIDVACSRADGEGGPNYMTEGACMDWQEVGDLCAAVTAVLGWPVHVNCKEGRMGCLGKSALFRTFQNVWMESHVSGRRSAGLEGEAEAATAERFYFQPQ